MVMLLILSLVAADAADGKAKFVGGTLTEFKSGQDGILGITQADVMTFESKHRQIEISFAQVQSIEYGQKVDRRYLAAILISPMFLLSKRREHYLTVTTKTRKGTIRPSFCNCQRALYGPPWPALRQELA